MYALIYLNIIITFTVFIIIYLNTFKFFFKNYLNIILLKFLIKKIKSLKSNLFNNFYLPNKIIIWKPIFKKTSYLGYFFNNVNKWK